MADKISITTEDLWANAKTLSNLAVRVGNVSMKNRRAITRMENACSSLYMTGMYTQTTLLISQFTDIMNAITKGSSKAMNAAIAYEEADEKAKKAFEKWFPEVEQNTIDGSVQKFKDYQEDQRKKAQKYLPDWAKGKNQGNLAKNFYKDVNGRVGSVAFRNIGKEVSCTYYTLRKLKERGLGFPFKVTGQAHGRQWYSSCCDDYPYKAPGNNSIQTIIDNYGIGSNGDYITLENIVVSFQKPNDTGHVLLIDKITKNDKGQYILEYSDMFYPAKYYGSDNDHTFPTKKETLEEFMGSYRSNMPINGAVLIGKP